MSDGRIIDNPLRSYRPLFENVSVVKDNMLVSPLIQVPRVRTELNAFKKAFKDKVGLNQAALDLAKAMRKPAAGEKPPLSEIERAYNYLEQNKSPILEKLKAEREYNSFKPEQQKQLTVGVALILHSAEQPSEGIRGELDATGTVLLRKYNLSDSYDLPFIEKLVRDSRTQAKRLWDDKQALAK